MIRTGAACSGAHFMGAAMRDQGHGVRLIPAQFVKPFLKLNRNDFLDAEAIAEAVARKNMRLAAQSRTCQEGRTATDVGADERELRLLF